MVNSTKIKIAWFIVGAAGLFAGCIAVLFVLIDRPVEREELLGLKVGMHRTDVLKVLMRIQVSEVLPEVDETIVVRKDNAELLNDLNTAAGICVNDNTGSVRVTVGFDTKGIRTTFYESASKLPGLSSAPSREEFLVALRPAILGNPQLSASNCIPVPRWIQLRGSNQDDSAYLSSFNTWSYHEPGSYSSVKITFTGDVLSRIEYRWRPFELP